MAMTRATIAALMLMASGTLTMAQTAVPAPAAPAASPAAPVIAVPAPAATEQNNPAWVKFRAACKADIAKHCGEVERVKGERGKMRACLETNKASLSSDCIAAIVERDAAVEAKKS